MQQMPIKSCKCDKVTFAHIFRTHSSWHSCQIKSAWSQQRKKLFGCLCENLNEPFAAINFDRLFWVGMAWVALSFLHWDKACNGSSYTFIGNRLLLWKPWIEWSQFGFCFPFLSNIQEVLLYEAYYLCLCSYSRHYWLLHCLESNFHLL